MLEKSTPLAALAAVVLAPPAFAHHSSGVSSTGGAGPIATISASTLEEGGSAAAVFFEMVKIDPFSDAQLKAFAGQASACARASMPSWRRHSSMPTA